MVRMPNMSVMYRAERSCQRSDACTASSCQRPAHVRTLTCCMTTQPDPMQARRAEHICSGDQLTSQGVTLTCWGTDAAVLLA